MTNFLFILLIIIIIIGFIYLLNKNKLQYKLNDDIKLKDDELIIYSKKLTTYQTALGLSNFNPQQLIEVGIPITDNIKNIMNNQDISKIDFSKYYPNELLFLSEKQVQSLSNTQIITISSINIHSFTSNITALTAIYNKLTLKQIQNIVTSDKYYSYPFNRLSPDKFVSLLKLLPKLIIYKLVSTQMFLTTIPIEHFNIIKTYLTDEHLLKLDNLMCEPS